MNSHNVIAYISERYGNIEGTTPHSLANQWRERLKSSGKKVFESEYGFMVYQLQGDAVILWDIYVKPEYRNNKQAWRFHDALLQLGQKLGKRVMIGFSEHAGQNHQLGRGALKAAGFQPAFKTERSEVFIKGI
jgi:GNAT superfamily N-acetyltransferase